MKKNQMNRRTFIGTTGAVAAGTLLTTSIPAFGSHPAAGKKRIAIVGCGGRGSGMWGSSVQTDYKDNLEFVGVCDNNPGRAELLKNRLGGKVTAYTDFEKMMAEVRPDTLIVTTVDSTHHQYIVRGLELGADIITEKPMTTDEVKCQAIIDAERRTGKNVTVTFNYRYSPHRQKLWEMLRNDSIGKIVSVDFHWYLDVIHGADYFRRWHGLREKGGTLLVHKASHHFDLLNWWIDSDPVEVFAFGALEHYGHNGVSNGRTCRDCSSKCKFHWDITRSRNDVELYVNNEKYDGYSRDQCVFRKDINIFDKMNASIKYADNTLVSYSLTTYSPYEGYRIAFNGTKGRLEAWIKERQPWEAESYDEIQLTTNFGKRELFQIDNREGGHGGGDARMKDKIFKGVTEDPYRQSAGTRDGAMSLLVGTAARKSIYSGQPVSIASLTDIVPMEVKPR
jgi:predicted dehydrogenase